MRKFKVTLTRTNPDLPAYIFYVYAIDEGDAILKVCNEHSDLEDVESIFCEEIEE